MKDTSSGKEATQGVGAVRTRAVTLRAPTKCEVEGGSRTLEQYKVTVHSNSAE